MNGELGVGGKGILSGPAMGSRGTFGRLMAAGRLGEGVYCTRELSQGDRMYESESRRGLLYCSLDDELLVASHGYGTFLVGLHLAGQVTNTGAQGQSIIMPALLLCSTLSDFSRPMAGTDALSFFSSGYR